MIFDSTKFNSFFMFRFFLCEGRYMWGSEKVFSVYSSVLELGTAATRVGGNIIVLVLVLSEVIKACLKDERMGKEQRKEK